MIVRYEVLILNILFNSKSSAYVERFGGAEISMKLMAEALVQRGHQVYYISKNKNRGLLPKLVRKRVGGVDVTIYSGLRRGSRFKFIRAFDQLLYEYLVRRVVNVGNIDLAYCTYELPILTVLLKVQATSPDLKIVMRMAGMYWYEKSLKDPVSKKEFERVFNSIDSINYVHRDQEQMVMEKIEDLDMDVAFKNSFIADIGFSVGLNRPQPYGSLTNEDFLIINVARFTDYQKRQDILVKAAALISQDVRVKFTLIGEGKEKEKIIALISKLGLEDKFTLMPFLSREELWREMIKADLMCHACEYEGLAKIILESMALGLPVLVSNVKPVNGYIEDSVNGFLVDNEPELWAKKIEALIQDHASRVKVSRRAKEHVENNYNPQNNIVQYECHFEKILEYN